MTAADEGCIIRCKRLERAATGIRDVPSGPLLRIGHDRYLPGLRRIIDAVRRASGSMAMPRPPFARLRLTEYAATD